MPTMKLCSDIPQSKKLAEFLPHESADMYYHNCYDGTYNLLIPTNGEFKNKHFFEEHPDEIPAWSLVALLNVLPFPSLHKTFSGWRCDSYNKEGTNCKLGDPVDNSVDACYDMLLKLHELKMI